MPYSSNDQLPESVRSRYSDNCQWVWRHTFNSVLGDYQDEARAFASATGQANKCQEKKSMPPIRTSTIEPKFKIFAPMLKASLDARREDAGSTASRHRRSRIATATPSPCPRLSEMERSAAKGLTIFLNHSYNVPEDVAGYVERAAHQAPPAGRRHPRPGPRHRRQRDQRPCGQGVGGDPERHPAGPLDRGEDPRRRRDPRPASRAPTSSTTSICSRRASSASRPTRAPGSSTRSRASDQSGTATRAAPGEDGDAEVVLRGTGVEMVGIEAPADGTMVS